jgi:hypothetical protein
MHYDDFPPLPLFLFVSRVSNSAFLRVSAPLRRIFCLPIAQTHAKHQTALTCVISPNVLVGLPFTLYFWQHLDIVLATFFGVTQFSWSAPTVEQNSTPVTAFAMAVASPFLN